jgi:Family of unknown function (DUF6338)
MNIWDADKLLLFILFVIPGFISIRTYDLLFPGIQQDSSKQIIDAVTYSSLNYALLVWPIMVVESSDFKITHSNVYALFYMAVLFVTPVALVLLWYLIRTSSSLQKFVAHPTLKPWDYVFSQRKPYWVKVVLKDRTVLGGKYAEHSFTSSSPANEQIYLEESWLINHRGALERPKNETAGILIVSNEIAYLELMKYEANTTEDQRNEHKDTPA